MRFLKEIDDFLAVEPLIGNQWFTLRKLLISSLPNLLNTIGDVLWGNQCFLQCPASSRKLRIFFKESHAFLILEPPIGNQWDSLRKFMISLLWSFQSEINDLPSGNRRFPHSSASCSKSLLFLNEINDFLIVGPPIRILKEIVDYPIVGPPILFMKTICFA